MARGKPLRNIRINDELWKAAQATARSRDETVSDAIRDFLRRYVATEARCTPDGPNEPDDATAQPPHPADHPSRPSVPYGERKPYTVADNLDDLVGPTSGTVTLPHHLDWSGKPIFNLGTTNRLMSMYTAVLSEASSQDDLRTWLNRNRLIDLWPQMFLPAKVRRLWEERFPELAATRTPSPKGSDDTAAPPRRPPADHTTYSERRPYLVADNLDDLTGPTSGTITLPHHIDWSGSPQRNLDGPHALLNLYPTVLAEAATVADLNTWINREKLIELWPHMWLIPKIRRTWMERFPELPPGDPRTP